MLRDDEESAVFFASCEKQIPRFARDDNEKNFFNNLLGPFDTWTLRLPPSNPPHGFGFSVDNGIGAGGRKRRQFQ